MSPEFILAASLVYIGTMMIITLGIISMHRQVCEIAEELINLIDRIANEEDENDDRP